MGGGLATSEGVTISASEDLRHAIDSRDERLCQESSAFLGLKAVRGGTPSPVEPFISLDIKFRWENQGFCLQAEMRKASETTGHNATEV